MDQPERHAHARAGEAQVPIHFLSEITRDERADERAEVDAYVKDGEPRIPPRVALFVQRAHQGAYVRLEQAGADHDQR